MKTVSLCTLLICIAAFTSCSKHEARTQTAQEYIDYTLDGTSFHLDTVNDTLTVSNYISFGTTNTVSYISGFRRTTGPVGYIILTCIQPSPGTGTYPSSLPCEVNAMSIPDSSLQVTVTSYANNIGDYFEGTFSGNFIDAGVTHTISGAFRAKRNY